MRGRKRKTPLTATISGIPTTEVQVTLANRTHDHSKKPAVVRYGIGFANAIVRIWLR